MQQQKLLGSGSHYKRILIFSTQEAHSTTYRLETDISDTHYKPEFQGYSFKSLL